MIVPPIKSPSPPPANIPNNKNGRIKKIAIEVLKVLGLAIAGALLLGASLISSGTIWLVLGASLGAATGVGSYAAGKFAVHLQKKFVFPAHRIKKQDPIDKNHYSSSKSEKGFLEALNQKIMPLKEYGEWKVLHGNISDRKAKRLFRKAIKKDLSHGESYAMAMQALKKTPETEPFEPPPYQEVFNFHMKIAMAEDLKKPHSLMPEMNLRAFHQKYDAAMLPSLEEFSKKVLKNAVGVATFWRKNQKKSLFFQVTDKGGNFYDGSHKLAGFHADESSQMEFIEKLHLHIKAGLVGKKILRKQYEAVEIELF